VPKWVKKQIFILKNPSDFMEISILGKSFVDPQSCFHDKIIKMAVVARAKNPGKRLA